MQPISFTTNRPRVTGGFGPPPPCGVPETLSFGAALALPSADPAQSGRLAGAPVLAGVIDSSVPGPDAPLVADLQRRLAAAAAAGLVPIVVVHDQAAGFTDSLIRTADLCGRLSAGQVALAPIVFGWPSVGGGTADQVRADRDRAVASAHAYARFLRAFAAARTAAGSPRALYLTIGMGALVTQAGGRVLDGLGGPALPPDLFDRAAVVAGAAVAGAVIAGAVDPATPDGERDQLARISAAVVTGDDPAALLAPPKRRRRR